MGSDLESSIDCFHLITLRVASPNRAAGEAASVIGPSAAPAAAAGCIAEMAAVSIKSQLSPLNGAAAA